MGLAACGVPHTKHGVTQAMAYLQESGGETATTAQRRAA
jgi:hypothetical protein